MKLNKKSLLYGTLILTIANFLVRILGFIYRIFLSRVIGAEGMGVYQLTFPLYHLTITLTASGIPVAVSKVVAQRKAVHDERGTVQTVISALLMVAGIATVISILIVFNVNTIAVNLLREPRTRSALLIFFPCILITGAGSIFKGYFYGTQDIHPSAISEVLEQFVRILLVVTILWNFSDLNEEGSAAIVMLGMVIGELSSTLYLNYCYYKAIQKRRKAGKILPSAAIYKQIISIAAPVTLTRLISTMMSSANSILIPQRLMAAGFSHHEAISTFGITFGMVMPLLFLPFTLISSLSVIIIPNLSENVMLNNWSDIRNKISKSIMATCLTAFPSMGLLIPLAYPIGIALYKQPIAGKYLIPLACSIIFTCLQHCSSSILNGLGKQNKAAAHFLIGGATQLFCTYFLVSNPYLGIYGYMIGFIASSILVTILNIATVIKLTKLRIMWADWFLKPAATSLLMSLIIRLVFLYLIQVGMPYVLCIITASIVGLTILAISLMAIGSLPHNVFKNLYHKIRIAS